MLIWPFGMLFKLFVSYGLCATYFSCHESISLGPQTLHGFVLLKLENFMTQERDEQLLPSTHTPEENDSRIRLVRLIRQDSTPDNAAPFIQTSH
mmetsp:Transcript_33391/g.33642  ORF Transcript_33391/g.33642 Transcript_33391/m.33642 type:complete len:94 (-) Transcript_33391:601-882(-)